MPFDNPDTDASGPSIKVGPAHITFFTAQQLINDYLRTVRRALEKIGREAEFPTIERLILGGDEGGRTTLQP